MVVLFIISFYLSHKWTLVSGNVKLASIIFIAGTFFRDVPKVIKICDFLNLCVGFFVYPAIFY